MKSRSALRVAVAASMAAALAILYPLYGDPRLSSVSHPEWARLLLRGLDMDTPGMERASVAFSALAWHTSLAFEGSEYETADAVAVVPPAPGAIKAESSVGRAAYPLTVARGGEYVIRALMSGRPDQPASAEVAQRGSAAPLATFTFRPATEPGWLEAGRVQLKPGSYLASVLLPAGAALDRVEVVPPCVTSIEPLSGWQTPKIASTSDVAVTVLKAIDKESELDPAGAPIDLPGSVIKRYLPDIQQVADTPSFSAGPSGAEGLLTFDAPEAGLYTISVRGEMGAGQRWLADGCLEQLLCASARTKGSRDEWSPVMTSDFSAGPHAVSVRLGPDASVEQVRIQRKQATGAAYVDAVRGLGLDVGPDGPVSRPKALEAMEWLKGYRRVSMGPACVELPVPARVTPSQTIAQIQQPGHAPAGAGEPPVAPGVSPFVPAPEVPSPVQ